MDISQASY